MAYRQLPDGRWVCYWREGKRVRKVYCGRGPLGEKRARQKDLEVKLAKVRCQRTVVTDLTLDALADRYLIEHAEPKKKARSVYDDRLLIDRLIRPALGKRKLSSLTRADLALLHHSLHETPCQANRIRALLSKMFNLAEKWGLRPDGSNPCRHIEKFPERKRERYLLSEELARLGKVLAKAEKDSSETPQAIAAIRLLLYTGCRLGEVLGLQWSYIDLEGGLLHLPDSKTGSKIVILPGPARDLLAALPRLKGNPYVLPGRRKGRHLVNLQEPWNRLKARAELSDVRLHDLRHSFASVGAAAGLGLPIIGALLGHTQAATTHRYAHLAADPLKQAADLIAGKIADALKHP